jgi:hypothetical protein
MERSATAAATGNNLTLQAGGTKSGNTDQNGGNLVLSSGTATGTGSSNITFKTAPAGVTGTADRAPATAMTILGNGKVGIGSATTAPDKLLTLYDTTSAGGIKVGAGSGNHYVILGQTTGASGYGGGYIPFGYYYDNSQTLLFNYDPSGTFPNGNYVEYGTRAASVDDATYPASRAFFPRGQRTTRPTLFLSNLGSVGIGTTSPVTKLDVSGGARVGADAVCSAAKAGMLVWNSNTLQLCTDAGTFTSIATSSGLSGASSALSSITAATANNSIANNANLQAWNWALSGANDDAFTFGESAAATNGMGSQAILKAATLASSTAIPLLVTNLGNGLSFRVNDETGDGETTPFVVDAAGNVGVGVTAPTTKLDVAGPVKIAGVGTETCDTAARGSMRYNSTGGYMEICQ